MGDTACKWKPKGIHFLSDQIDFQTKIIMRDRQGHHYIMMESVQQEDVTFVNILAPIGAPKCIKASISSPKGRNTQ